MCDNEFPKEEGTYHIDDKDLLYCDEFCLNEEILIQEEEALTMRIYERSRYVD